MSSTTQCLLIESDENDCDADTTLTSLIIEENEEVGFFLLENTDITLFVPHCRQDKNVVSSIISQKQWIDIEYTTLSTNDNIQPQEDEEEVTKKLKQSDKVINEEAENEQDVHNDSSVELCSRCNIILQANETKECISFVDQQDTSIHFDGFIKDIKCCQCHQNQEHTQRSDAAVLLGTLLACKKLGYLRIEQFQMLFMGDGSNNQNINDKHNNLKRHWENTNNVNGLKGVYQQFKVSIVITVSLPHLEIVSRALLSKSGLDGSGDKQEVNSSNTRKRKRNEKSGSFHAVGKLMFSLIRSDWTFLEKEMKRLSTRCYHQYHDFQDNADEHSRHLFPFTMSLEELYMRIQGAETQTSKIDFNEFKVTNKGNKTDTRKQINRNNVDTKSDFDQNAEGEKIDSAAGALSLPEDILQGHIASYLRAKSLHSLRITCKYLHRVLKAVVPGMKLQLFQHQVNSLYWMRARECTSMSEYSAMQSGSDNTITGDLLCGDLYRSVTAGNVMAVVPRSKSHLRGEKSAWWNVDCSSGAASRYDKRNDDRTMAKLRKVARGGLLCDDPGLGKTITVLSLILQTLNQSTSSTKSPTGTNEVNDDLIVNAYWREGTIKESRRTDLLKLLKHCRCQNMRLCDFFELPVDNFLKGNDLDEYNSIVQHPICFDDIKNKIMDDEYTIFSTFVQDVTLVFSNAIMYNNPITDIYKAATEMSNSFYEELDCFKSRMLLVAEKARVRSKIGTDASFGALIKQSEEQKFFDALIPSSGTLIVVPNYLVQHWEEQINLHVDFSFCTKKQQLIYRHGGKSSSKNRKVPGFKEVNDQSLAEHLCETERTHVPIVFIDASNGPLPSADFLSKFKIVITTTKRLTAEWKNGDFQEEFRRERSTNYKWANYSIDDVRYSTSPCPFLKIHWLRLIVDEGHSMGKGSRSNAIQFSSWITAQRRWAMTGTPTPQRVSNSGVHNLLGLVRFLKHDYFCCRAKGEERCKAIAKRFKDGDLSVFFQLRSLLNLFMVRHTKENVLELRRPIFSRTYTDMSNSEILAYNTLVSAIQMNIFTTSMEGKTSGRQDSLLNVRQSKHARVALNNVRLACCGGREVQPTLTGKNFELTIKMMRENHHADEINVLRVENFLRRMTSEQLQLSSCMTCGMHLQTLFLLPCSCLVCTECIYAECVKLDAYKCPVCNKSFDIDDFQTLQPGLDYNWKWNIEIDNKNRESVALLRENQQEILRLDRERNPRDGSFEQNPNPDDLNRHQDGLVGISTSRNRRRNRQTAHTCIFPDTYIDGKCSVCREVHDECKFDSKNLLCEVCHCQAENCPKEESKSYYITNKLLQLWESHYNTRRPLKAIVFSQFREILNVVGDRLIRRFGRGRVAEYWGSNRNKELSSFSKLDDCFCMLLGQEGSHGLNLSFVTHIFFLDEIFDKSLESQVVARAYRMGAIGHVKVEQLVAKNSIEENMIEMNKRDGNSSETLYAKGTVVNESKQLKEAPESVFNNTESLQKSIDKTGTEKQANIAFLLSSLNLVRDIPRVDILTKAKTKKKKCSKVRKRVQFQLDE